MVALSCRGGFFGGGGISPLNPEPRTLNPLLNPDPYSWALFFVPRCCSFATCEVASLGYGTRGADAESQLARQFR